MEELATEATSHIESIQVQHICELMAFSHPSNAILLVSRACLRILAGVYHVIKVNHKEDPVDDSSWDSCKRMYLMSAHDFLKACKTATTMVGRSEVLDRHIDEVRSQFMGDVSFEPSHVMKYSIAIGHLCAWMHCLVRYKEALYLKREQEVTQYSES